MAKFVASVSSEELSRCIHSMGAFDGAARLATEKAIANGTRRVAGGARRRVAIRSGLLKKSIKSSFNKTKLVGMVRAKTPYAHLVEFGAKPVSVKPKKKKALKFAWGNYLFRGKARIPKRKAKPFIIPAYKEEEGKIIRDIKEGIAHAATSK